MQNLSHRVRYLLFVVLGIFSIGFFAVPGVFTDTADGEKDAGTTTISISESISFTDTISKEAYIIISDSISFTDRLSADLGIIP